MSGLPGQLALIIAFCLAILSGISFGITSTGKKNLFNLGRKAYNLQIIFIGFAILYLWFLFFNQDYSIKYVYEYSSSDLPFFYKFSSLWAGQDGTYLMWLMFSLLLGLILFKRVRQFTSVSLAILSLVNLFLYSMMLTLSPFRQLDSTPLEGSGLNPLLQNPWMVIHPPVVFIGFALAGIVFALVIAMMIKRNYENWIKIIFPYITATALTLAIANVLGGYWAYITLGWGGYWAWDPVENTSFIPWIIAMAVFHGMLIEKRIGALRRINLFFAGFIFLLSIYGTFLTRSGVLADFSVHSFVDLGANAILISFVSFYLILTAGASIYSFRSSSVGKPMNYNIFSREFMLFVGMILLFALGLIVLFWSSLPFITTYLTDSPRAAEIPTYNMFAFPLAILIALFLTLTPFIKKGDYKPSNMKTALPLSVIISLVLSGGLFLIDYIDFATAMTLIIYLFAMLLYLVSGQNKKGMVISYITGLAAVLIAVLLNVKDIHYLFFIFAAAAALSSNMNIFIRKFPNNLKASGGSLSHIGYGLMLLGILASSAFSTGEKIILPRGETGVQDDISYQYKGLSGAIGTKDNEVLLTLIKDGKEIEARPHYFYAQRMDAIMKRPHVEMGLFYDLYLSPQEIQEMPHSQGLVLAKGDSTELDEYKIRFKEFEIGSHSTEGGPAGMAVGVVLEVEKDGQIETTVPRMINSGEGMETQSAELYSDKKYMVEITQIDADNGMAMLSIPGLVEAGAPDRLILDISYKPGINLLWLGTILVFVGMALSVVRRLKE